MSYGTISALRCHCEVCGHEWITEVEPKRCAKCKSRRWDGGEFGTVRQVARDVGGDERGDRQIGSKGKGVPERGGKSVRVTRKVNRVQNAVEGAISEVVERVVPVSRLNRESLIPGELCPTCKFGMYAWKHPTSGYIRWKCVGPIVHTITPREGK
jgi:hypothetical protein